MLSLRVLYPGSVFPERENFRGPRRFYTGCAPKISHYMLQYKGGLVLSRIDLYDDENEMKEALPVVGVG